MGFIKFYATGTGTGTGQDFSTNSEWCTHACQTASYPTLLQVYVSMPPPSPMNSFSLLLALRIAIGEGCDCSTGRMHKLYIQILSIPKPCPQTQPNLPISPTLNNFHFLPIFQVLGQAKVWPAYVSLPPRMLIEFCNIEDVFNHYTIYCLQKTRLKCMWLSTS